VTQTLRQWIHQEVSDALKRGRSQSSLILWCDPEAEWKELLAAAAEGDRFELWIGDEHELVLRDRLAGAPRAPRVVWLRKARDEITYMKVMELQADSVWTEPLASALRRFGVQIPDDDGLRESIPAQAREWIDRPPHEWEGLQGRSGGSAWLEEDRILAALASPGRPLAELVGSGRLGLFGRRMRDDYGLPAPPQQDDTGDAWREGVMARLLATEAAKELPGHPLPSPDLVIPPGRSRERSLKLLNRWRSDVNLLDRFEAMARRADSIAGLTFWARSLDLACPPLSSPGVEAALFEKEVAELQRLDRFEDLSIRMQQQEALFNAHASSFWGKLAARPVPWRALVSLAKSVGVLARESEPGRSWETPADAVRWFTDRGWEADREGENLWSDDADFPAELVPVRARARRAYLRHLDRSNAAFSELLARQGIESLNLPFAGQALAQARPLREPMAVLVLDACRYDLGRRLEERLNHGEPAVRARTVAARAPLPSITALGMPFALAEDPAVLAVELSGESAAWRVTASDARGDLTLSASRKEWLRRRFKLKPEAILDVKSVLEEAPPSPREAGRMVFVFGSELDVQGHEDELRFTGAEDLLARYGRAILRLRDAGYTTIAVVTDHGFLHWEPDQDEILEPPGGEILWRCRRAVVGHQLSHPTAVAAGVPRSALECCLPRSVGAFRGYGNTGFFHGGASLQELIIPVVLAAWPKRSEKVRVVLKPVLEINSLRPRLELQPGETSRLPQFGADEALLTRQVVVRVVEPATGRRLFGPSDPVDIHPGGECAVVGLARVPDESSPRGTKLRIEVRDADNDELLDQCEAELKVDMEEWD
jgi:hypothetical protein